MEVKIVGAAAYVSFGQACIEAAGADFDRRLDQGLKAAGDDLGRAVLTSTEIFTPSGYDEVFRLSVASRTEVLRGSNRGVAVTVYAHGARGHQRDVQRLEKGILRHPVYGRLRRLKSGEYKPNPWSTTRIRPGFISVPMRFASPRAFKRIDQAMSGVLEQIGRES